MKRKRVNSLWVIEKLRGKRWIVWDVNDHMIHKDAAESELLHWQKDYSTEQFRLRKYESTGE